MLADIPFPIPPVFLAVLNVVLVLALVICLLSLQRVKNRYQQCNVERGTDELTGLWNRSRFMELAERQVNYVQRTGRSAALLLVDLDECKKINQNHGHLAGDEAVRLLATAAKETVRDYDILGRYSGEEIVILLPDTQLEGAQAVARRFRERIAVQKITTQDNRAIGITVSIGVAALRCETDTLEDMLVGADVALGTAKAQGRDRVVVQNG